MGARAGFQWDYVFDWTILKYQQAAQPRPALPPQEGAAPREARRTAQDEERERERERHQTSFNRSGTAEGSRRRRAPAHWHFGAKIPMTLLARM